MMHSASTPEYASAPSALSLNALTVASLPLQAYLRMADISYVVSVSQTTGTSPTGIAGCTCATRSRQRPVAGSNLRREQSIPLWQTVASPWHTLSWLLRRGLRSAKCLGEAHLPHAVLDCTLHKHNCIALHRTTPHRIALHRMAAGCLPAVEMRHGLGGHVPRRSANDLEAAAACLAFLKDDTDLDRRLPGAAAAECAAFSCLLDSRLAEAVRFSMWCEWASLSQLPVRPAGGAGAVVHLTPRTPSVSTSSLHAHAAGGNGLCTVPAACRPRHTLQYG